MLFNILKKIFNILILTPYYKIKFAKFGSNSHIGKSLLISKKSKISIGNNVNIGKMAWLAGDDQKGNGDLIIKDGVYIGNFAHIYSIGKIVIEENALIADKVYISDNLHGYEDIHIPISKQDIKVTKNVTIGADSWLGEHVCVIGVNIGRHCVIGANSVVTKDIPDYCIAVGSPAKVIKRYNFDTQNWEKTDKEGNFIN